MTNDLLTERKLAIMQLRQGKTITEVARNMNRSPGWVTKWKQRYAQEGWPGLKDKSRAPIQHGNKLSATIRQAICQTRLELEAEASLGNGLKYIGGRAIRTRMRQSQLSPLPSIATIERVIREAGLTKPSSQAGELEVDYPHLQPTQPHQLCQVDIVPHFLQGGQRIPCFNAIDVVSRYPTGRAYERRRSQDAADFLIHVWQELGIAQYTQVDNEGCFSGGTTHTHVLGKVVRLALSVGTELVFSPVYHPQSNSTVERFHQDYNRHVWQDTYLSDLAAVNQQGDSFFALYRQREDHSQLDDLSPAHWHQAQESEHLDVDFQMASPKLPLCQGRVHFIRKVTPEGTVRVLNADWTVPQHDPTKGVWVTLNIKQEGATLAIYDQAPDVLDRRSLAQHLFPLQETVVSKTAVEAVSEAEQMQPSFTQEAPAFTEESKSLSGSAFRLIVHTGEKVIASSLSRTARLARHIIFTMY